MARAALMLGAAPASAAGAAGAEELAVSVVAAGLAGASAPRCDEHAANVTDRIVSPKTPTQHQGPEDTRSFFKTSFPANSNLRRYLITSNALMNKDTLSVPLCP